MSQPPQGMRPPKAQQIGASPGPFRSPPGQQGPPSAVIPPQQWQPGPPIGHPGMPVVPRPAAAPGHGWWITSAVLDFIGAASAAGILGLLAVVAGWLIVWVGADGGGEGVQQMTDDFLAHTTWLFHLFVAAQFVSIVLGLWGGRNCLRGRVSGAVISMLLGSIGLAEAIWLGLGLDAAGGIVLGVLPAVALIVCPAIALRFTQPRN